MIERYAAHLLLIAVTLWVGALWAIGFIAAPTLFAMIPDRSLAGNVAGRLFELTGWIGIGCAAWILLHAYAVHRGAMFRNRIVGVVMLMLVASLATQFWIQPLMVQMKLEVLPLEVMASRLAERFARWHGISSLIYVAQSVLGLILVGGARRLMR
ncbi:MAG TPA: DUF4149 domain-containing protein [Rhodocyclaceae bacterium]|nr:DUF4149 domain-containing protein [Rhodocyclaceae bacterium]